MDDSEIPELVLASASPRRQELLRNADFRFIVVPANVEEVVFPTEAPEDTVMRLASEKARAVARDYPAMPVLGADTLVVVSGVSAPEVLSKPANADDAARMLGLLSGRAHQVVTGVCLLRNGQEDTRCEVTKVWMESLTPRDIQAYVASGEPMDKAGAYAIQGGASKWVGRIEGDFFNIVGLPLALVYRMLRKNDSG